MSWNRADDGEQYEVARRLNAEAGRTWTVMWAPALRAYVAFYQGTAAVRWQSAPTAEGLVERLREAERRLGADGGGSRAVGAHRRPAVPWSSTAPVPTPVPHSHSNPHPVQPLPPTPHPDRDPDRPVPPTPRLDRPAPLAADPDRPALPVSCLDRLASAGDRPDRPAPPAAHFDRSAPPMPRPDRSALPGDRPAADARAAGSLPRAFDAPPPVQPAAFAAEGLPGAPARGGARAQGVPARTGSRDAAGTALRRAGLGGPDRAVVTARLRGPRTGTRTVVIPGEGAPPQARGPIGTDGRVRGGSAS